MAVDYLGSVPIPPKAIETPRYERPIKSSSPSQFKKVLENEKLKSILPPNSIKPAGKGIKELSKVPIPSSPPQSKTSKENGTDLAVMEVAREFEKQFMGLMWDQAFATVSDKFEGGLGEEFFRKEYNREVAGSAKPGDIAQLVYEELMKDQRKATSSQDQKEAIKRRK